MHVVCRARRISAAAAKPILAGLLLAGLFSALGCSRPAPATASATATADRAQASQRQQATSRIGDVTIHASAVQTSTLDPAVARRYGIERADDTVMLLVAMRQGPQAQASSLPAQVSATVTDLRGHRQPIVMRELRSGDLLDYVGTVEVALPDSLRFDVTIVREGGARSTMQFSREFYPR